ncbi:hypothetical protein G9A89_009815 [Geosiphon pyriformis]|nr:hypothetical protein G9A89_009815 [Geosiphon pyriformis]
MAESEIIGANHLRFAKFLFQQYSQLLGLNNNHYSAESAFNYYVNDKITDCLKGAVNIESARKNFYMELFQHTSLLRNHSFAPIIRKINQTIERYTQQQFPITYADKGKRRIQTLAATPKEIQLPSWKKHRVESPTALLYYYTPRSTINILSADLYQPNQPPLQQPVQQPFQPPPQQLQQPVQQQMVYTPIAKLEKFTGNKNDAQTWINDVAKAIVTNNWNNTKALQAIPYFL